MIRDAAKGKERGGLGVSRAGSPMKIERAFAGKKKTLLTLTISGKSVETVAVDGGKEKKQTGEGKYAFEEAVKTVAKLLKSGEVVALKDPAAAAEEILAGDLELDLSDVIDLFGVEERRLVVDDQVARAEKKKTVVGPEHAYARASIFHKAPTQALLRHFLACLHNGSLKYKYDSGGMNGDLQFFATAISNAARDANNVGWIVEEVNRVLPDAEPDLKAWLKARISKFKEQAHTKKALATAPKAPAEAEEGVLAAIANAKTKEDDLAARLVWADWLQERNHPWGEVVSLQCEEEGESVTDERREAIRERLSKIQSRAATQFLAPIKAFISEHSIDRGTLNRVTVSVDKLLKPGAAEAIQLRAPGAELELKGLKKSHVKDLAKLAEGHFGALKLGTKPPEDALAALLASPLVRTVTEIEIWGVDDGTLEALAKGVTGATGEGSPTLRTVRLWYSTASSDAIAVFAKKMKSVEDLSFPSAKEALARAAVEAIATELAPSLRQLHLPLAESGCGASLAKLTKLESLTLMTNGHWDDNDCKALAKLVVTKNNPLKSLDIRTTGATEKGMTELLALGAESLRLEYAGSGLDFSKAKPSAEAATFVSSDFSDKDAVALTKSAFGKKLSYLEIRGGNLGDTGAEALMSLDGLSLYLEGMSLSDKVTKKLAALRS
jgi:uncharacterized protein (TIGR02996 family)